jgi:hypothetical protein
MGMGEMVSLMLAGQEALLVNRWFLLGERIERTGVGVFLILGYQKSFRRLPLSSQSIGCWKISV